MIFTGIKRRHLQFFGLIKKKYACLKLYPGTRDIIGYLRDVVESPSLKAGIVKFDERAVLRIRIRDPVPF
jgi:hypothetical protein